MPHSTILKVMSLVYDSQLQNGSLTSDLSHHNEKQAILQREKESWLDS